MNFFFLPVSILSDFYFQYQILMGFSMCAKFIRDFPLKCQILQCFFLFFCKCQTHPWFFRPEPNPPMILYGCSIFITRANDVTNIRRMNPLQSEEKMIDTKANECLSFKKVGRFSKAQPPFASIKMS